MANHTASSAQNRKQALYRRIYEELYREISEGKYAGAARLASENELCRRYQTSRQTVRLAVDGLINKGLVERVPGKGLYLIDQSRQPLRSSRAHILVVSPQYDHQNEGDVLFDAKILQGIRSIFAESSVLELRSYPATANRASDIGRYYSPNRIDGLILISPPPDLQRRLGEIQVPLVVFGHLLPGVHVPHVRLNMFKMGYDTATTLLGLGHSRWGMLSSSSLTNPGVRRFIEGAENALVDYHQVWNPADRAEFGNLRDCLKKLDNFVDRGVSAIILDGPDYAMSVYHHLQERNLPVPEAVSFLVLEMNRNMTRQPPFFSGFFTDHFAYGQTGAQVLAGLMSGERTTPGEGQRMVELEFYPGKTLAPAQTAGSA